MGRKLLVNIDDAGASEGVDEALDLCIRSGVAGGASLMATGAFLEGAADIARTAGLQISAHLDCIEGPFLSEGFRGRSLASLAVGGGDLPALEREWRMQIEALLDLGLEISRLDSHRHLHHLPAARGVVIALARDYSIPAIRTAILPDRWKRPSGPFLHHLALRLRRLAHGAGLRTNDCMLGFGRSGRVDREYLERMEGRLPEGLIELVVHPSTVDEWSGGQRAELDLLLSSWFATWLERVDVPS